MTVPPQARPDGLPLTDTQLAEIEARVNAAPEGPWLRFGLDLSTPAVDIVQWAYADLPPGKWEDAYERASPTLDFIAHARTDIPALLAEVRRGREALRDVSRKFTLAEEDARISRAREQTLRVSVVLLGVAGWLTRP